MIRDWEIPTIGNRNRTQGLNAAFCRMQDTLLHGSPLLVDQHGKPATELRTGGTFQDMVDSWSLFDTPRILGPDGKPPATDWNAPVRGLYDDPPPKEGLTFSLAMPYQAVMIRRPKGWRRIWHRIRWFFPNLWSDFTYWLNPEPDYEGGCEPVGFAGLPLRTSDLREELRPILEDPPIRVRNLAEITEVWNKAQGPLTVRIPADWIDWEGVKGIASVPDPEDPRPPR